MDKMVGRSLAESGLSDADALVYLALTLAKSTSLLSESWEPGRRCYLCFLEPQTEVGVQGSQCREVVVGTHLVPYARG